MNLVSFSCSLLDNSYNVHKGYAWFHLPLQVTNKAICWTALAGFALTQLPGILAHLSNAIRGNSLHSKPYWLRSFLGMRKHLGLLSLWFLMVHILMSLLLFSPAYYGKFFLHPKEGSSKLNSIGENSLFFAVLGTSLYIIMGICSLPSVAMHMTNKQWQVIYGPVAWIALSFGTVHVLVMGVKGWDDQHKWPGNMPPITLTSVLIPLVVLFLKVAQVCLLFLVRLCLVKPRAEDGVLKIPSLADETGQGSNSSSGHHGVSSRALVSKPDSGETMPPMSRRASNSDGSVFEGTD